MDRFKQPQPDESSDGILRFKSDLFIEQAQSVNLNTRNCFDAFTSLDFLKTAHVFTAKLEQAVHAGRIQPDYKSHPAYKDKFEMYQTMVDEGEAWNDVVHAVAHHIIQTRDRISNYTGLKLDELPYQTEARIPLFELNSIKARRLVLFLMHQRALVMGLMASLTSLELDGEFPGEQSNDEQSQSKEADTDKKFQILKQQIDIFCAQKAEEADLETLF